MKQRPLGLTGLRVSELGFGTWQLGGRGWGAVDARTLEKAVGRALDLGVNLFDTAGVYGFGRSEALLSRLLGSALSSVIVVSKGGLVWDDRNRVTHDARPDSLRRELEGSLRRLRRDHLDVWILHWPDPRVSVTEAADAMEAAQKEGKVRAWGISNHPVADVLALGGRVGVLEYPVNVLGEHAEEYRSSARSALELLGPAARVGWGFLAFDVLARGLLGGRYGPETRFGKRDVRSRDVRFQGEAYKAALHRVANLREIAQSLDTAPAALAIRAVLDRAGVTSAIVGMKSPQQVEECASISTLVLTEEIRSKLAAEGLQGPGV